MREIKFRAWDKERKVMSKSFTLEDIADGFDCGYAVDIDLPDTYGSEWDDVIFMQFTDLHDKNGKEIYEGDIVTSGRPSTCWEYGEVMYRNSAFRVHAFVLCQLPNCEVVGNVHENLELVGA